MINLTFHNHRDQPLRVPQLTRVKCVFITSCKSQETHLLVNILMDITAIYIF
ncbi:hypothetical protein QTP70_029066, partial [Hemibagrus guttatus]